MPKLEESNKSSPQNGSQGQEETLEILKKKFPDIPEDKLIGVVKYLSVQRIHSGPLPSPEVFAGYEKVFSGAAERILVMAENQAAHRQFIEKKAISSKANSEVLGVIFAFIIAFVGIIGGIFLIYIGKNIVGLTTFIGTLGSLIWVFIFGKKWQNKELEEKRSLLPDK
ncbi:MAG: DUF2335 domain-containing protein [Candidatus Stahlbacteria bacterium]|nr:DUF2335 domain-containing protein [Candidatus Stahlbacteria bacterium]